MKLLLVCAVCFLVPAVAAAQSARVAPAQRAYDELRFDDVLREVAAAREKGDLARADAIELFRLEAYTYAGFDDRSHAVQSFSNLLELDPQFRLPPGVSPKIRQHFAEAQQNRKALPPAAAPTSTRAGAPATASVETEGRPGSSRIWLWGGIASVAIGAVAAVVLLSRPEAPKGDLGTWKLP